MKTFVLYRKDWLIGAAIATLVILMIVFLTPFESGWAYNTDEAIEMSRVFHVSKGFKLYREVWSDHPPGWTWLLYAWSSVFGISLLAAKILAALLSALSMVAFYATLKLFFDRASAIFGILLFCSTARFVAAVSGITIDTPSLGLGWIGMSLFLYGLQSGSRALMIASGLCLAYAMTIKFFTALLIITLFGCTPIVAKHLGSPRAVRFPWLWLAVIAVGFLLLMLTYWPFPYYYLVEFHKNARGLFTSETLGKLFRRAARTDSVFLIVSAVSIAMVVTVFRRQLWRVIVPLVLLGLTLLQFSVQRPVWWIYYPLIAFPLAWIACLPFAESWKQVREGIGSGIKKPRFLFSLFLLMVWILPIGQGFSRYLFKDAREVAEFRSQAPAIPKQQLFESIQKNTNNDRWLLTDDALFALRSQIPIPPIAAVLSVKRILTERLDDRFYIGILEKYRPEQIVMDRFADALTSPRMREALKKEGYRSLPTPDPSMVHYVRGPG
jgi:4-amino-4-deoxy-L-arabinose transferase-like glycosyltransferase